MKPALSVIVPAHNEAAVIDRCLEALFDGPLAIDVVVAANGCTDGTVERARSYPVKVVETRRASKAAALNAGDGATQVFPRLYVDADVVLHGRSLARIVEALSVPSARVVVPRLELDLSQSSAAVRWYYDVWRQLPYARNSMGGSGVYGLNKAGRRRFEHFPELIGDDAFIYGLFSENERMTVEESRSTVFAPRTLGQLVRVRARIAIGNRQIEQSRSSHSLPGSPPGSQVGAVVRLAVNANMWGRVLFYLMTSAVIRLLAFWRQARGSADMWVRDESSRVPK